MIKFEQQPVDIDNPEESSGLEPSLSPEQIDGLMRKLVDVNAEGMAVTWIRPVINLTSEALTESEKAESRLERLGHILRDGLLGVPRDQIWFVSHMSGEERKKKWVENIKKRKIGGVYFNILGKSTSKAGDRRINKLTDAECYAENGVGVIFDSKDVEEAQRDFWGENKIPTRPRTFWSYKRPETWNPYSEEYGFVLAGRIPPRMLKGIVIDASRVDIEKVKKEIATIIKDKPQNMLPIYDTSGNLMWPKQINYEEVISLLVRKN